MNPEPVLATTTVRRPQIRCTARAMIVRAGHMLMLRADDPGRPWLFLPGGGCGHGETLAEACRREVLEETGIHIVVERPIYLREYIASRHRRRSQFMPKDNHALGLIFLCHPDPDRYLECRLDEIGCFPGDADGTGATTGMVWVRIGEEPPFETMPPHIGRVLASREFPPDVSAGITWWPEE